MQQSPASKTALRLSAIRSMLSARVTFSVVHRESLPGVKIEWCQNCPEGSMRTALEPLCALGRKGGCFAMGLSEICVAGTTRQLISDLCRWRVRLKSYGGTLGGVAGSAPLLRSSPIENASRPHPSSSVPARMGPTAPVRISWKLGSPGSGAVLLDLYAEAIYG